MDAATRDEETGDAQNPRPTPPPQRQRASIPSFLFLSFVLFMLTSHNGDEFLARHQHQDALQSLTWQLGNYSTWMNGTESNFTMPDRDSTLPPLLESFHIQGKELNPFESSYYPNITGFIHGATEFYNISAPALAANESLSWRPIAEQYTAGINMTQLVEKLGEWNWTSSRKVSLSVVEKKPVGEDGKVISSSKLALVHGRIELTDVNSLEDLHFEFEGVHFLTNGSIYGFAEPNGREIDIRLLPSLVPNSARNETAQLIGPELEARIEKLKGLIDAGIVDQDSNDDEPKTTCPFTFYAQIHPVPIPEFLMQELEEEMQNPTGISIPRAPPLSISGILVSKECGLLYEVYETEGLRSRTFFGKVTTYAGLSGFTYLILLVLSSRQHERSRNPSGISRACKWTFLAQATMDSVSFAGHITFAILADGRPSLSLIAPAFLACMLFVQEAQFFALVNQIQAPENYTPPAPNVDPSSMTFPQFLVHHIRTDPQARLWIMLFVFLTLVVRVILSPTLSMVFVAASYSLIWLPQIIRSARRGRTSGFTKEYILGITACRLFTALYFLMCPRNVLEVEPRPWAPYLAFIVISQALLLILQDTIGPSFFLPERFKLAKPYDYHPPIPLPDDESPDQSLGDCAICMDAIYVEPSLLRQRSSTSAGKKRQSSEYPDEKKELLKAESSSSSSRSDPPRSAGGLFGAVQATVGASTARKSYSLAPCHHLFHTDCLEKWLAIKNICPHCRRPLPPL